MSLINCVKFLVLLFMFTIFVPVNGFTYHRSLSIGTSGTHQLKTPTVIGLNSNYTFPHQGFGLKGSYNLDLSEKFSLEIIMQTLRSIRAEPSELALTRLVYGLQFKHYFNETLFKPYVYYGLLFQLQKLSDTPSTSASHDTSFGLGGELYESSSKSWQVYAEASYHYNRLRYFSLPTSKLDYMEMGVGVRFKNLFPPK